MPTAKIVMKPVESSQIAEVGYDDKTNTLAVRFTSKKGKGSLYHYGKVPPDLHMEFMGAESKGTFFGQRLKNAKDENEALLYPYERIQEEPETANHDA